MSSKWWYKVIIIYSSLHSVTVLYADLFIMVISSQWVFLFNIIKYSWGKGKMVAEENSVAVTSLQRQWYDQFIDTQNFIGATAAEWEPAMPCLFRIITKTPWKKARRKVYKSPLSKFQGTQLGRGRTQRMSVKDPLGKNSVGVSYKLGTNLSK